MKFNFIILVLFITSKLSSMDIFPNTNLDSKVNIELLNITTNGKILPDNTISFNGVENLEIEFDVKISYNGNKISTTSEGILNCFYYEPNSFDNEIAQYYNNGVQPFFIFEKKNISLVYENGVYIHIFRKKILFKKNTIYHAGSSFVFRYRTSTLSTDISNKLTIKLIDGSKTGNETYQPNVANISLTSLSYADGTPIIDNKIIIPDSDGDEIGYQTINLTFNFNYDYGSKLTYGYYPSYGFQIKHLESTTSISNSEYILSTNNTGNVTIKNLRIDSSQLLSNDSFILYFRFQDVVIRLHLAFVKGKYEKPILDNTISDHQTIAYGEVSKPFTLSQSPYVDYSIRCTRNIRDCKTIYDHRYITSFKWQTRTQNTNWTDILGATSKEYSPNKIFHENTYYRRLAYFNNEQYSISNTSAVIIQDANIKNTICCDQSLPNVDSQPEQMTGNISTPDIYTYQWQFAKEQMGYLDPWHDIIGATDQNYNHTFSQNAIISNEKTLFRRIIKENSFPVNVSNTITILRNPVNSSNSGGRRQGILTTNQTTNYANIFNSDITEGDINNTSIYPNPFSNSFTIEGPIDMSEIKLYDSFGKIINIERTQKSQNLIEVNTTNLQSGLFLLKIDNTSFSKILYKN